MLQVSGPVRPDLELEHGLLAAPPSMPPVPCRRQHWPVQKRRTPFCLGAGRSEVDGWTPPASRARPVGHTPELQLFGNLRPAILYPQLADASSLKPEVVAGLDILIVRELTGGIYFGEPRGIRILDNGEREGFNTYVYRESEIRRIAHLAFNLPASAIAGLLGGQGERAGGDGAVARGDGRGRSRYPGRGTQPHVRG